MVDFLRRRLLLPLVALGLCLCLGLTACSSTATGLSGDYVEDTVNVAESFVRSAEGRPLELIRTYEELSGQAEAMGESQSMENVEELEGKSVRFEARSFA